MADNGTGRMTLGQARLLADQWKEQRDDAERQSNAGYFRNATPHEVIQMWATGRGRDGRKLRQREVACLVERWAEMFGTLPPDVDHGNDATNNEPLPPDDTTLPAKEVERLLGVSKSTLKRMVKEGRFPPARRTGIRTRGWPTRDVRDCLDALDEQRKRPRQ